MKLLKLYGLALLSVFFAFAYANAQTGSIKVASSSGGVTIINGSGSSVEATANYIFTAPATIITDGEGDVLLYLSNGAVLEVKAGSRVEISHFSQEPFEDIGGDPFQPLRPESSGSQVGIRVVSGSVAANVSGLRNGSTFLISTPTSDIQANEVVVVVGYDAATATTTVANVGGNGNVSYESSTPGSQPVSVPAGQALTAPGQLDSSTGAASTSGQPTTGPASPQDISSGQQVSNPPATPAPVNPAEPTTPPAGQTTTPQTDIPELIDPTTTGPL